MNKIKSLIYSFILGVMNLPNFLFNLIFLFTRKKKIFLFDAPYHGNLGDQAIALAEHNYFRDTLPDYLIIEVDNITDRFLKTCKCLVNEEDVIVLHGGGNFGDEYIEGEYIRHFICKQYPKNKIYIFPQTVFYKNKEFEERSLQEYRKYGNLKIFVRERESYEHLTKMNMKNVFLVPDIVFYLFPLPFKSENRNKCLLCMRSDNEVNLSSASKQKLKSDISNYYETVEIDTVINRIISPQLRKFYVYRHLKLFSTKELVITDRLHGMIFAAITRTPCIVFGNYNHKIKSTYQTWIKNLNYVVFLENVSDLKATIERLNKIEIKNYEDLINTKNVLRKNIALNKARK
ncbi:polysaccharide pyruvyl transferase family protein [Holdemania massiliensis]|uniref:polysaccharide pyruvyl transferase family protein n=1 Tax=Holdemania massiliensis TaxID=1468449 RepID=UPI002674CB9E|nr:polysaccharide pyruvyl transferase family protein [Holdemania massiliensis]